MPKNLVQLSVYAGDLKIIHVNWTSVILLFSQSCNISQSRALSSYLVCYLKKPIKNCCYSFSISVTANFILKPLRGYLSCVVKGDLWTNCSFRKTLLIESGKSICKQWIMDFFFFSSAHKTSTILIRKSLFARESIMLSFSSVDQHLSSVG